MRCLLCLYNRVFCVIIVRTRGARGLRETEIKAACSAGALTQLEDWLERRGFVLTGELRQEDDYYEHPARSFAETDEAVRIRREYRADEVLASFAYKGPNMARHGQEREELETRVADAAVMCAALERLGFKPVASVYKQRKTLVKGDVTVCLDRVDGLGCFFELEILGTEDGAARLESLLEELRFLSFTEENRSYLELL